MAIHWSTGGSFMTEKLYLIQIRLHFLFLVTYIFVCVCVFFFIYKVLMYQVDISS